MVQIDVQRIPQTNHILYLGSVICEDCEIENDMMYRIKTG